MSSSPEGLDFSQRHWAAWGRLVVRHRRLALVLSLLTTGFLGTMAATRLKVDTSLEAFLATNAIERVLLEEFRDTFGRDDIVLALVVGDVFSRPFLERMEKLHDAIAALQVPELGQVEVVAEVLSLINARKVSSSGDELIVSELGRPLPSNDEELAAFRERALGAATFVGQLVSAEGDAAAIVVRMGVLPDSASHVFVRALRQVIDEHRAPGFEIHTAGTPALAEAINAVMLSDAYRALAIATALICLLLAWMFRHWFGVVAAFGVVVQAVLWTVGLMALTGHTFTPLHNILPTFLLSIGLCDAVHLVAVFSNRVVEGHSPPEAVVATLATTGTPIFFTSATTALGLVSFMMTRMGVTTEFGIFAAVGVGAAFVHSIVFLPAALATPMGRRLAEKAAMKGEAGALDRMLRYLLDMTRRRGKLVLVGLAALLLAIGAGFTLLRVSHNPMRWLPADDPTRIAFETADSKLGGTVNLEVMVRGEEPDAVKNPSLLNALAGVEAHMRAYEDPLASDGTPLVKNAASILNVLRESWTALTGEAGLPETRPAVAQTLLLFDMSAGPEQLARLVTPDYKATHLSLRVPWRDAGSYGPLTAWLDAGVVKHFATKEGVEVHATGGVYTLFTIISNLIEDMIRSFGFALILIGLMMILLLRDLKLGLVSLIPNVLPVAATVALMAYMRIPVDMFNLLIGSISIGLAVDDTIHFFHHFRHHRMEGESVEDSLVGSMRDVGRAMVMTSVVLFVGFCVFVSARMGNLATFGMLSALTVAFALLADLILGPVLLRLLYRSEGGS